MWLSLFRSVGLKTLQSYYSHNLLTVPVRPGACRPAVRPVWRFEGTNRANKNLSQYTERFLQILKKIFQIFQERDFYGNFRGASEESSRARRHPNRDKPSNCQCGVVALKTEQSFAKGCGC